MYSNTKSIIKLINDSYIGPGTEQNKMASDLQKASLLLLVFAEITKEIDGDIFDEFEEYLLEIVATLDEDKNKLEKYSKEIDNQFPNIEESVDQRSKIKELIKHSEEIISTIFLFDTEQWYIETDLSQKITNINWISMLFSKMIAYEKARTSFVFLKSLKREYRLVLEGIDEVLYMLEDISMNPTADEDSSTRYHQVIYVIVDELRNIFLWLKKRGASKKPYKILVDFDLIIQQVGERTSEDDREIRNEFKKHSDYTRLYL